MALKIDIRETPGAVILDLHGRSHECSTYDRDREVDHCTWCLHAEECSTLRSLAAIYGNHPDYRQEWAP